MSEVSGARGRMEALPSVLLPPVVREAGAAVLIVDLARGEVTYANDLARELVPDRRLPLAVDEWSAAAGLEDVTGLDLPEGDSGTPPARTPAESLLRVAKGEPVTGEAVTAARATSVTRARETLWVLGLPLVGAPEPISSLALVVFLPARNAQLVAGAQQAASDLRDRAVLATLMSFTITDPTRADNPLVWVNPAFTTTTGYTAEEVTGRNCRFLQGPETDMAVVDEIRDAIRTGDPVTTTLLNYRKDGTPFWNELSISPIRDGEGVVTHYVGVQADVTDRVQTQRSRDDALAQVALAADRMSLLADFTSRMAMSLQPRQIMAQLADMLVPRMGTWVAVYTVDDNQRLQSPVLRHARDSEPAVAEAMAGLRRAVPDQVPPSRPVLQVLAGEASQLLIADYAGADQSVTGAGENARTEMIARLGADSVAIAPLVARSRILGCVVLVTDGGRPRLDEADLAMLRDLAARAGLMLENTQLYAREQQAAATLQRSLLPRLPRIPGIEIAAQYIPSSDEAAVGGDWYDVFALRDGGVGVVVGDVMGHDYDSAARMGKLSTIVRSYAYPGSDPSVVLTAVDELIGSDGALDILATCLLGTLQLGEGGATLRYSSAGHPPALIRLPDGSVSQVMGGDGPMIGVAGLMDDATRPPDAVHHLPSGTTLICFTDGLLDAYGEDGDIDAGLAELARIVGDLPSSAAPRRLVDTLVARAPEASDDVAIVAIRIG